MAAAHPVADGTAAEVRGAAGLAGYSGAIKVLVRDQRAVAQQGHGSVVLRRWFYGDGW